MTVGREDVSNVLQSSNPLTVQVVGADVEELLGLLRLGLGLQHQERDGEEELT